MSEPRDVEKAQESGLECILRTADRLALAVAMLSDLEWSALKSAEDLRREQARREHPTPFDAKLLIG